MKSGEFSATDVASIKQSVRKKDRNWRFIKRNLKSESKRLGQKLRIVELGAGTGSLAILIGRTDIAKEHICIDNSKEMLNFIKLEKIPEVKILKKDLEQLKPLLDCDVFIAKYLFHHINDKKRLLKVISQSLSVGGKIIIIDKFPKWGVMSLLYERFLDLTKIKPVLGTHYYVLINEFERELHNVGLKINLKEVRRGKKFRNCHMKIVHYLISKDI